MTLDEAKKIAAGGDPRRKISRFTISEYGHALGFLEGHAAGERAMRGKAIAEIDNYPDINLEDAARLKNNIYALPLEAADKEKK